MSEVELPIMVRFVLMNAKLLSPVPITPISMSLDCHFSRQPLKDVFFIVQESFKGLFLQINVMSQAGKRAILLMNLGSPDSTSTRDVHTYLMEFLMDKRVIDYPWLFRKILVGGLIVPFRAAKSAEAYSTIWTAE